MDESYCRESACDNNFPECGLHPEKCRKRDEDVLWNRALSTRNLTEIISPQHIYLSIDSIHGMASHTISFNVSPSLMEKILAFQRCRRKSAISVDLFCKGLVIESTDEFIIEQRKKEEQL